jgi:hypothetical protein
MKKLAFQSGALLFLGALISGQVGPCGAPAVGGGGGGGSLVGVWRATYNDPFVGPTVVDLVLQANGNFTETYTSATTFTYIAGGYTVDVGQQGLLRLTVLDWFPKEFLGTPIQPIAGESWLYSFNGPNNLTLTNFYCTDLSVPGCVLNHTRVN